MTYERVTDTFRTPGGHSVVMTYRTGTNDWNTLNASLNEDEYGLPSGLSGTGLDVGGYLGSVGIALALDNPAMRVVIIEPVPDNAELIALNIERNNLGERVTLLVGAVGAGAEQVTVRYGFSGSDSLTHHAFVGNTTIADTATEYRTVTYPAFGLAELIDRYAPITVIKIDTEGAEWPFFAGRKAPRTALIVGEWHARGGNTRKDLAGLFPHHVLTFSGPAVGAGGFRADHA